MASPGKRRDVVLFTLVLLLILAAFTADRLLPLGVAGGVPYVVPVGLTLWFFQPTYTWTVAGVSGALILLDIALKPAGPVPLYFVILNRSYAFLAIGIVLGIGQLQQRIVSQSRRLAALSVVEERERLSRELHDDLSQSLGGIGARVSAVSELLAQGRLEDARQQVEQLRKSADEAYLGLRQHITGLRMRPWGDQRFLKALEEFASTITRQAGLALKVEALPDTTVFTLAPAVEVQTMRIVQEALLNATRHADARTIALDIKLDDRFLQIDIQDDGHGFEPDAVDSHTHLGLQMMRERAELVGGRISIDAMPGRGAKVTVRVPCERIER